jgi:hypothetical protein
MANLFFIQLKTTHSNRVFRAWWHPDLNCFTFEEAKGVISEQTFPAQMAAAQNHARELFANGKIVFYEVLGFKIGQEQLSFSPAEAFDRWTAVLPTVDRPAR